MELAANVVTALVGVLHVAILILEMFLWTKPAGMKAFRITPDFARASRVLAANQGLYNGFLAAGLLWGVYLGPGGQTVRLFFLGCVVLAGVFGGITASRKILFVQAGPAAVALLLTSLANVVR